MMPTRNSQVPPSQMREAAVSALKECSGEKPHKGLFRLAVRELQEQLIIAALEVAQGNSCQAAELLGVHRNTLSRQIAELNLTQTLASIRITKHQFHLFKKSVRNERHSFRLSRAERRNA